MLALIHLLSRLPWIPVIAIGLFDRFANGVFVINDSFVRQLFFYLKEQAKNTPIPCY